MLQRAERQRGFAAALLDPERPIPDGLVGPDREPSAVRFAVYRNNVFVGLIDALKESFPATCKIAGDDFFRAMVRAYVMIAPPASPILLDYGAGFAKHVESFGPAQSLPYLADVARIERAWLEAYHAAEAEPLDASRLASIDPQTLPQLRLRLHPSPRVVRSKRPALTIWRMNVADGAASQIDLGAGGEDALIVRPAVEVETRYLPPGGAEFIQAVATGAPVLGAAMVAWSADAGFDLGGSISGLIGSGAIVGCTMFDGSALSEVTR